MLSGAAAFLVAAGLWAAQAVPALRINSSLLFSVICWLFAYFCFALKTSQITPRFTWVSRALAITVAAGQAAQPPARNRGSVDLASRPVYRRCGQVAAFAITAMAATDALLAFGVIRLAGVNLLLTTLFVLGAASECLFVRVVGPKAEAAELAIHQARAAARYGTSGDRRPLTLLDGAPQSSDET
jgi:hypothetical protein